MPTVEEMSLRDWFAGQALQAIAGQQDFTKRTLGSPVQMMLQETARRAYELADAMLRVRGTRDQLGVETPAPVLTTGRLLARADRAADQFVK